MNTCSIHKYVNTYSIKTLVQKIIFCSTNSTLLWLFQQLVAEIRPSKRKGLMGAGWRQADPRQRVLASRSGRAAVVQARASASVLTTHSPQTSLVTGFDNKRRAVKIGLIQTKVTRKTFSFLRFPPLCFSSSSVSSLSSGSHCTCLSRVTSLSLQTWNSPVLCLRI